MRTMVKNPCCAAWHAAFTAQLPRIEWCLMHAFRHLDAEMREEAVQEGIVDCCLAFHRLMQQGRPEVAFPTILAGYAVRRIRAGRRVGVRGETCDLLAWKLHAPRNRRSLVNPPNSRPADSVISALAAERQTPVPDQAAFRIDLPEWLSSMTRRTRRIARDLACGWKTGELSRKYRLSAARISQIRSELYQSWHDFHGITAAAS